MRVVTNFLVQMLAIAMMPVLLIGTLFQKKSN